MSALFRSSLRFSFFFLIVTRVLRSSCLYLCVCPLDFRLAVIHYACVGKPHLTRSKSTLPLVYETIWVPGYLVPEAPAVFRLQTPWTSCLPAWPISREPSSLGRRHWRPRIRKQGTFKDLTSTFHAHRLGSHTSSIAYCLSYALPY